MTDRGSHGSLLGNTGAQQEPRIYQTRGENPGGEVTQSRRCSKRMGSAQTGGAEDPKKDKRKVSLAEAIVAD
jgi:hypothetical protein